MIDENKDPSGDPPETDSENKGEEKPTLESIAKQNRDLNEKLEKVLKQNSDKDSFITKLQGENKTLRGNQEKILASLEGKSDKQKDAILERRRREFIESGYDEKSVDLILDTINEISEARAEKRVQEKIVPLIMDGAQELIESDPEIDPEFLEKNNEAIMDEYSSYKQEVSPRKIKSNLKKAYNIIKEQLAGKAKTSQKPKDERDREAMLAGGKPGDSGKGKPPADEDFIASIEKAGQVNSHFI